MIVLLTDNVEKRCAVTTDDIPRRQLSSVREYPGVRVVNVPSDTYEHHSELESSSDIRTIIRLNAGVLVATSLYTIAFIHLH